MKIGFEGQRVVVTGAGHGIGRGIARAFAELGATTLGLDINTAGLKETAAEQNGLETAPLDVTDASAVQAVIAGFGPVDILVHSAGGVCGQAGKPVEEVTLSEWQAILAVNLTGAFLMAQAVIPAMKAAGHGRIVTISSGAGIGVSLTGIQAYAAAKAGEIGLTRQLAHELGPFGVTVNSVAPGFVRSNPTSERQWEAYGSDGQKRLVETIALRRLGTVADITNAVLFFASDYAGWISGQTLSVDGGK
ncbi:SDR family oxidoreductase [Acidisoma cellulosilytica]|uniref:SDR family oxidoreductase n=1 Tax=Acidisoma cellulosilyticum TaxID=2802395 RepID=A0A964E5I9_9PROT|nr:SDR family NAD(P)-dependent oxidoreductase [Acidisoma cellulosilyticum]MCB8882569.1 SDR family oxidoreductase [Acidisoma cellulosilyticum]